MVAVAWLTYNPNAPIPRLLAKPFEREIIEPQFGGSHGMHELQLMPGGTAYDIDKATCTIHEFGKVRPGNEYRRWRDDEKVLARRVWRAWLEEAGL